MWRSISTWGSPLKVAELHKLGIEVAKSTVEKYKPHGERLLSATWRTFLDLHLKDLVAIDLFVVPTPTFEILFVFVVQAHDRRKIVHFSVCGANYYSPHKIGRFQSLVISIDWVTMIL